MKIETFGKKNYRGEYECKSHIDLSDIKPAMELQITTHKGNKCIKTYAQVGFVSDGCFTFVIFQDYNKTLKTSPSSRVTEKQIDIQHTEQITKENLEFLIEDIKNHYN